MANDGRTAGDQAGRAALHHQASNILRILVIVWQAREINRSQQIGLKTGYRSDQQIMPEIEHPVAAISVLQANSIVVPNIVSVNLGTLKYEVLAFGPPVEVEVLGCVADVGSRHEARVGMKVRRYILIHEFVRKASSNPIDNGFVILTEGVTDGS